MPKDDNQITRHDQDLFDPIGVVVVVLGNESQPGQPGLWYRRRTLSLELAVPGGNRPPWPLGNGAIQYRLCSLCQRVLQRQKRQVARQEHS